MTDMFYLKYDQSMQDFGLFTNQDIPSGVFIGIMSGVITPNPKGEFFFKYPSNLGE